MRKIYIIFFLFLSIVSFGQTKYYVATTGSDGAAGTIGAPFATMQKAVDVVVAGDSVFFRAGVYTVTDRVTIDPGNGDGDEGSITFYGGYPADIAGGDSVVFDYATYQDTANLPKGVAGNYSFGILINNGAGFIHFKNFTIRNVKQHNNNTECNAITSSAGHNLTFENIIIHDIGGRGLFHETPWGFPIEPACGYDTTRYINCDVYRCADSLPYTQSARLGNQADGIKSYGNRGSVIYYTGCRVWDVSDDGWDSGSGTIIHYENCWSFRNGLTLEGDGDGFKIGSHNDSTLNAENPIIRFVTNCIAAENDLGGFRLLEYWDYYRQRASIYNNFAYQNDFSVDSNTPEGGGTDRGDVRGVWRNNISFSTNGERQFGSTYEPVINEHHNSWDHVSGFPGWVATDTVTITTGDFISLDVDQLDNPRKSNGKLPDITFSRLSGDSDLIHAGVNVGMSDTTDMGVDWEYFDATYAAGEVDSLPTIYSTNASAVKSIQALLGGNITSSGGAAITARGVVWGTSANPTLSNNVITVSGTTGSYTTTLTGLSSNTTYHVRSFATNSEGTSYGADVEFTTTVMTIMQSESKTIMYNGNVIIIK